MLSKTISNKVLFKALERTKFGSIKLTVQNPYFEQEFGDGPKVADVWVMSAETLHEIVRGGDIELASAIIRGDFKISDETAFVSWACKNDDVLVETFHGKFLNSLLPRLKRIFRPNTIKGAKKNIMDHYDLGNDFYNKWLDPSMTYSSAIFSGQKSEDLQQAQMVKYDRIIDQLGITSGDRVLEIGCGWGGFFSRAIERMGCHVTAVMNSPAQAEYNRELIKAKGLQSHVNLELIDYRQIQGKFDKAVSIEMIEAVGKEYWPVYFQTIAKALKPGGKGLVQSITIRENRFEEYSRNPDFINTMIFPGGMLLTNGIIAENVIKSGMRNLALPYEFGQSYAETLRRWKDNFLQAVDAKQLPALDEKFINLWRFYLSYCEGAFAAERINVGHYLMELPRRYH